STTTEATVITMLLVRLTQSSWSGRPSTSLRLASVGGIGRLAGLREISSGCLSTLTATTYSGTKNSIDSVIATSGRSHGTAGPPPPTRLTAALLTAALLTAALLTAALLAPAPLDRTSV